MRVVMLSWEYPPKIVGGIARHVEELSWALAARGNEVHVVTCEFPGAPAEETYRGVHVHRVAPYTPTENFFHWVHQLNAAMRDRAEALLRPPRPLKGEVTGPEPTPSTLPARGKRPTRHQPRADSLLPVDTYPPPSGGRGETVIHAHDWLAHFAGKALKHQYRLPLVATIHATEFGRNNGIHTDTNRYINSVEWELAYEAWRVIVCSEFMRGEVQHALNAPGDKLEVIPNGVHAEKFDFDFLPEEAAAFRSRFAAPNEKLIFFVGRMVREKGVQILIEALPKVRLQHPNAKLIVVGGGYRAHLEELAQRLGVAPHVYFTGFLSDDDLLRLYKVIDVACFPSLYEPFGIVALEAMAAGVPVVVSDAGGLKEVVEHDVSGTVTWANNADSLAWGILRALNDPAGAARMAANARERVHTLFTWDRIAAQTQQTYARVWQEYETSGWGR